MFDFLLGGHKNWHKNTVVATLLKILQVKSIIPDLNHSITMEFLLSSFILKHKYNTIYDCNNISTAPHTRYVILKVDTAMTREWGKSFF